MKLVGIGLILFWLLVLVVTIAIMFNDDDPGAL